MAPKRLGDEARRVGRERARVLARSLAVWSDGCLVRGPEHDAADAVLDGGDDGLLVLDPTADARVGLRPRLEAITILEAGMYCSDDSMTAS